MENSILAILVGFILGTLLTFIIILLKEFCTYLKRKLNKSKKKDRNKYREYYFRRAMGYTKAEMEERANRAFEVKIK